MKDSKTEKDCNGLCFLAIALLVVVGALVLWVFSSALKGDVEGVVEGMFLIGAAFMIFGGSASTFLPEEDSAESRADGRNRESSVSNTLTDLE